MYIGFVEFVYHDVNHEHPALQLMKGKQIENIPINVYSLFIRKLLVKVKEQ